MEPRKLVELFGLHIIEGEELEDYDCESGDKPVVEVAAPDNTNQWLTLDGFAALHPLDQLLAWKGNCRHEDGRRFVRVEMMNDWDAGPWVCIYLEDYAGGENFAVPVGAETLRGATMQAVQGWARIKALLEPNTGAPGIL